MNLEPFVFSREGVLVGLRERASEPGLLDEVNRFALRPLGADEFAAFTLDLCNNRVDRHFSRFPDEELEVINGMVPGRPLMERHDLKGTLPRGTFFRSQLYREEDALSVRPDVYVLRTPENENFIANIEGGVYRETSIGFSFQTPECSICGKDLRTCNHVPGRTYSGKQCHYVMRGVIDVIEGSVVPAGSQGTGFVAQERALPLASALDRARRDFHEPIELSTRFLWAAE
ncbi:MAG: hypothetical protein RBU21_06995 [FCB group bacterium]|jgi:hypothetical protein|nr:hypothetical protein [FCB group bacterium]